jgi:Fur family ferric uptake transcriptional regulator
MRFRGERMGNKMPEVRNYSGLLKREGLKSTKHRNSILAVMENSGQPITAEQVFLKLKEKNVSINLSSVYRILDALVVKGLVIKSSITGDSKAFFELNRLEHKHFLICSGCKKRVALAGCPLEAYEKSIQDKMGFDITGHRLEIYGYCRDCKPEERK